MSVRPPVSVIVPFFGGPADAVAVVASLERLQTNPGDELIVADNTPDAVAAAIARGRVRSVPAGGVQSSYYARNVGADGAANEWLLFMDADCTPRPDLLDRYFEDPPSPSAGAVAGEVVGSEEQDSLAARYSRSRRHIGQAEIQDHPYKPMAVTANLLVRRAVWSELGGFHEGVRSGGDSDFSWRLQDAGWELGYAAAASVEHRHRESVRALLRQSARYGAGMRWLRERHPGVRYHSRLRDLARAVAGVGVWTVTGRFERALFKGLDGAWTLANVVGSLASNVHAPGGAGDHPCPSVLTDRFPAPEHPRTTALAQELAASRHGAVVEAATRVDRPDREAARGLRAFYLEDDGAVTRAAALLWLASRHPLRSAVDLARRPDGARRSLHRIAPWARRLAARGSREIVVAADDPAAADARRIGRLLGIPVSESRAAARRAGAEPVAS